jgi:type II secretory ATPase GspE/PulE/Tfp pilus assembly ATPase PilB-like protein
MAQRLVRTLCPHCKEKVPFAREEEHRLWESVIAPFKAPRSLAIVHSDDIPRNANKKVLKDDLRALLVTNGTLVTAQ